MFEGRSRQNADDRYRRSTIRLVETHVSTKIMKEVRAHGGAAPHSGTLLSLEEVRSIGLPAYFSDHGERLLYQDGELFDLGGQAGSGTADHHRPKPLPRQILEAGVGIEYGWRHAADCGCPLCWKRARTGGGSEAVA